MNTAIMVDQVAHLTTTNASKLNIAKSRTTFISLPREIRQKILYQSSDLEICICPHPEFVKHFNSKTYLDMNRIVCDDERKRLGSWYASLTYVHDRVCEDLPYVWAKWMEDVEQLYEACKDGSKGIILIWEMHMLCAAIGEIDF
jgi:hypothetical protein